MRLNLNLLKQSDSLRISEGERDALKDLERDQNIKISPADKGGSIVLQDLRDYIEEDERQFNDTQTYGKTDIDLSNTHK